MKKVLFAIAVGVLPLVSAHPAISQSLDQQFNNEQSTRDNLNSLCPTRWKNAQYQLAGSVWSADEYARYLLTEDNKLLRLDLYPSGKCKTSNARMACKDGRTPTYVGKTVSFNNGISCLLKVEGDNIFDYHKTPNNPVKKMIRLEKLSCEPRLRIGATVIDRGDNYTSGCQQNQTPKGRTSTEGNKKFYIVADGDTLEGILDKFQITFDRYCELNGHKCYSHIKTGRKIRFQ